MNVGLVGFGVVRRQIGVTSLLSKIGLRFEGKKKNP